MENNVDHLCASEPFSGTLPHDLDIIFTPNGSIPEELPTAKELGDSSYESAEDIPNGSAGIKADKSLDDLVANTSEKGVEAVFMSAKLSHLCKLLVGIVVCVVFLMVAVAVCSDVDSNILSCVWQYFTSNNDAVPFIAPQNISNSFV